MMTLPFYLLGVMGAVALALALFAPVHWLLLVDPLLVGWQGGWEVAGIRFDPSDLALGGLAVALALRTRRRRDAEPLPGIRLWALLVLLVSLAFLQAPGNQQYLTDPVRILYQLYRYAWRPLLYYPLALLLLAGRERMPRMVLAFVASADIASFIAIPQGYRGMRAAGPFHTGNELGGALVLPLVLCFAGLFDRSSRVRRWFYGVSGLVIARALLFSGSRGAFIAVLAGAVVYAGGLLTVAGGRLRVLRLSTMALVAFGLVWLLDPDLFQRPNVRRLLSVTQGTKAETLRWRIEERWPHFAKIALAHPALGTGTDVDLTLGKEANTPHCGYLSLALLHGLPAAALFVAFAALAIHGGVRAFRRGKVETDRLLGLALAAAVVGLLVHNVEEGTWIQPLVAKVFWIVTAFAVALPRLSPEEAREADPVGPLLRPAPAGLSARR
jgi:O-antigen ligase/polysaccharide polymerase Wzy-like membrane protein